MEKLFGNPSYWSTEIPVLAPEAIQALVLTEITVKWAEVKGGPQSKANLQEARNEIVELYNSFLPDKDDKKKSD